MNDQKPTPKGQAALFRLAQAVSLVGSPFLLALLLLLIVSWHATHRAAPTLGWAALTAFFVTLGPLALLAVAVRRGKVRNLDIDVRSERPWPMVAALVLTVLGLVALWLLGAPHLLVVLLMATLLGGAVALLITLRWKISIHSGGAAGSATVLAILYGAWALPLLLGVVVIGWSRVVLGKHTWAQVVAGAVVSALVTLLVFGVGLAQ
jgi:membrane-associated phospholipid phosphatase